MERQARRRWEREEKSRRGGTRWIPVAEGAQGGGNADFRNGAQLRKVLDNNFISFFFSDFPTNWTRESMWKYFGHFGHVMDVFVPAKKTRDGKAFGFVRYKGVNNVEKLVNEVRGVAVGSNWITFNVAKYGKEDRKMGEKSQKRLGDREYHISPGWKTNSPPKTGGVSYAEALMGKKERVVEVVDVDSEETVWLQKCAVGEVKNTEILNDINHLLRERGFLSCAAKYLGGMRVLVECSSTNAMEAMLREGSNNLLEWFDWIQPWDRSKELSRPARLVWLNIEGVPLHAWNTRVFEEIAREWGDIKEVEDLTASKDQVCIGRVCVATQNRNLICECINLVVEGESFSVRILENLREVMDFGPRYEVQDGVDSSMAEENDDRLLAPDEEHAPIGSAVAATPVDDHEEVNGRVLELTNRLHALNALDADDEGKDEETHRFWQDADDYVAT